MKNHYFDGSDYQPRRDDSRLSVQYIRIFEFMKDGQYRTLKEISDNTNDPEASISAQLRHMRKERFGGHTVNKIYIKNGLYTYQLILKS